MKYAISLSLLLKVVLIRGAAFLIILDVLYASSRSFESNVTFFIEFRRWPNGRQYLRSRSSNSEYW
ncbi:hypothetical protein QWZ13_04985 [Reinekea marina]|uniref:hypothetical protein n=1 Tax=Reinekea marina TaxID=1310421 RepID=UPI0025B29CDF|nr:hypothetical protein [Reinekea marina]MDN3648262.1 hypothetical protein [Reinekea marina]